MIGAQVGLTIKGKELKEFGSILTKLASIHVLVGVPEEDQGSRQEMNDKGQLVGKSKISNAALAFIHDQGSPLQNIPARPFMKPGIDKARNQINRELRTAAQIMLDGGNPSIPLNTAGLIAQNSIRKTIMEGVGFDPLKRATLLARLRKRKALHEWYSRPGMKEKKEEFLASMKPLMDTNQMLRAIGYVVEEQKK